MENTSENKLQPSKTMTVGLLAHVDAGKTTLAEAILYETGAIRRTGRVDHGDAFLDTHALEKDRGITIFSKQALFRLGDQAVTLLDTPGHVDFSAEAERVLQVLDCAVLVISGADGVQGHVETLWRLLERYRVPVFLFINKMDQPGTDQQALLKELGARLSDRCLDFTVPLTDSGLSENLAVSDEALLERYLETGTVTEEDVRRLVAERRVFPCYFGSALKQEGIGALLEGLSLYGPRPRYPEEFGARVYKISRDSQNTRLTHIKVTGGSLKVKQLLTGRSKKDGEDWEEKADQIRLYSGAGYTAVNEAAAGTVCAVTGLEKTYSGEGLGFEADAGEPLLEPVLEYRLILPEGCDPGQMYLKLSALEEEEPLLRILWEPETGEIRAQVMGEVQTEILRSLIKERFGVEVSFGAGNIVYKETIQNTVEGIGHFEPLRHYAEVHLLMEPGERGSGLQLFADCSQDVLDKNWQRLVLTHLAEKRHRGVLTGAELTDVKITLVGGRSHLKHTEGGDFRQATYRAVRQGLMQAESLLLEPVYEYRLEIPADQVGRALSDIQRMNGSFAPPIQQGDTAVLTGKAPVASMRDYQTQVTSYTRGRGHLFCTLCGYEPCHNAEEVIQAAGYDPEADPENPSGSVFCSHGAGFTVPWDQVRERAHVECFLKEKKTEEALPPAQAPAGGSFAAGRAEDKELEEIFVRTYGPVGRKRTQAGLSAPSGGGREKTPPAPRKDDTRKQYLLVDGYNIIFAWDELKELAKQDIGAARTTLMDILSNYQGYKSCTVILVFDAYRVEGGSGEIFQYHNIHVVYTKEAETADQYIEKTVHEIGKKYQVTVATSDGLEQVIILGQGGRRMSAMGLKEEIYAAAREIREQCREKGGGGRNYLFDYLTDEMAEDLEQIRLGKKGRGDHGEKA